MDGSFILTSFLLTSSTLLSPTATCFGEAICFSIHGFIKLSWMIDIKGKHVGFTDREILDSNLVWLYLLLSSLATCMGLCGQHSQSKPYLVSMETRAFVSLAISSLKRANVSKSQRMHRKHTTNIHYSSFSRAGSLIITASQCQDPFCFCSACFVWSLIIRCICNKS